MTLPERKLLDRGRFLEYVASGQATAIDLVIRNRRGGLLLTRRAEEPVGLHFPGSVRLPGEQNAEVINWVGNKELGVDLSDYQGQFLGHTQERFSDKVRDPRGPLAHDVYGFVVENSFKGEFFETIPLDLIPQHRKLVKKLGIEFGA